MCGSRFERSAHPERTNHGLAGRIAYRARYISPCYFQLNLKADIFEGLHNPCLSYFYPRQYCVTPKGFWLDARSRKDPGKLFTSRKPGWQSNHGPVVWIGLTLDSL